MLIGAHVSVAGGLDKAIDRGAHIGANCVQTFASSPRSMKYRPYDDALIEKYLLKRKESAILTHVFHGVYLINLAHEKAEYVEACVELLGYYQELAGRIDGVGTVFHIGSHKGKGLKAVIDRVAGAIVKVLEQTPEGVKLMLENAAGHGGTIGQTLEELAAVYETVDKQGGDTDKLGFCLDTQHAFAGGYDFLSSESADEFYSLVDSILGVDNISCVHVNDSSTALGSQTDRHANIGEGEIGTKGIEHFIRRFDTLKIPFILEVPGEKKSGPRKQDIEQLVELVG